MLTMLSWLLAAPVLVALGMFSLELIFGLARQPPPLLLSGHPRIAVLVPAHDEAGGIAETVRVLVDVCPATSRVVVVADNCTDETAQLAKEAGADVYQRNDPVHRGKGYALAFGRDRLAELDHEVRPDVVIVIDADCRLAPGSASTLAGAALYWGAPVQARNLQAAQPDAPPLTQISNFAMLVKNLVRARGLQRLAGGILLFGPGMAFPWQLFAQAELATADTVEDLRLGIDLSRRGHRIRLVEAAEVSSAAPAADASSAQRRRWEHGFLRIAARHAVPLIGQGLAAHSRHLLALGCDLIVPPLSLLMIVAFSILAACGAFALLGSTLAPIVTLGVTLICALALVFLVWAREGRDILSGKTLLRAPAYVMWKVPIYVGILRSSQGEWNRTRRIPLTAKKPEHRGD